MTGVANPVTHFVSASSQLRPPYCQILGVWKPRLLLPVLEAQLGRWTFYPYSEWFSTTKRAQIVINHWLRQYNNTRPHQSLTMRPPVPETILGRAQVSGPETGG